MKKITTLGLILFIHQIYATDVRHSCQYTLGAEIATVGDSRAEFLATFTGVTPTSDANFIQKASTNGKQILNDGQIYLENRAQYGSMASEWVKKIQICNYSQGGYKVPKRTIISMGGNDVLDYIKEKKKNMSVRDIEKYSGLQGMTIRYNNLVKASNKLINDFRKVSLKSFLKSPFKVLGNMLSSLKDYIKTVVQNFVTNPRLAPFPDFAAQFEWQDNVAMDKITTDMKQVLPHFLDQSYDHQVMLNIIQPVSPIAIIYAGKMNFGFFYTNVMKLFNHMRTKYRQDLYSYLEKRYGHRIILLDTYWAYANNIRKATDGKGTFYDDGIHFSRPAEDIDTKKLNYKGTSGMEYWARMIALTMVSRGWYQSDMQSYASTLATDVDVQFGNAILTETAKSIGIDPEMAGLMPAEPLNDGFSKYIPQDPIIITYLEMDYEFDNDKSFYVRNGDNKAYMVRGDIRLMYEGNGGPDGALGFPIQDEFVGSIFESFRIQAFECGTITKNYFDLITPQKIEMNENSPTCLEKKARDMN